MENKKIRVTVWNEFYHERNMEEARAVYPDGIHECIAGFLKEAGMETRTAYLDLPEHGLTEEVLDHTDVLIWWGHIRHQDVSDEVVDRVFKRIQQGMGLILLHSAHASKLFHRICGTETLNLKWRESGDKEILWVTEPGHPIAAGLNSDHIVLEHEETYGERFEIPKPDDVVFLGWFSGGEVFRSGCCYTRGKGHIFYFQPGHETFPTYHNPEIQKVIINAVKWAAPTENAPVCKYDNCDSIL